MCFIPKEEEEERISSPSSGIISSRAEGNRFHGYCFRDRFEERRASTESIDPLSTRNPPAFNYVFDRKVEIIGKRSIACISRTLSCDWKRDLETRRGRGSRWTTNPFYACIRSTRHRIGGPRYRRVQSSVRGWLGPEGRHVPRFARHLPRRAGSAANRGRAISTRFAPFSRGPSDLTRNRPPSSFFPSSCPSRSHVRFCVYRSSSRRWTRVSKNKRAKCRGSRAASRATRHPSMDIHILLGWGKKRGEHRWIGDLIETTYRWLALYAVFIVGRKKASERLKWLLQECLLL